MYLHANIKLLRKRKGLTQSLMAESLGISRSKLAGYELNVSPPLDTLVKICEYLELSVDLMLKQNLARYPVHKLGEILETSRYLKGRDLRILATTVDAAGRELIEVVSQKARASYLAGFSDPDFIGDLPRFHLPFLPQDKKHRVFQVDGDSMDPIPDGAWIICEYMDDWTRIKDGEKYVIVTAQDGVTFKLAYNQLQEKRQLLLCSSNPLYKPFEVAADTVREVWKYRMMLV
ncbi:XRE family transcriptional regulator [Cyclobacterium plantarum]|uniref:Helix-turn-helix domain-containing protein n=1 Tax=Cyclobacterium plantarum TaxID=2716263 RepID=A0ABX0H968_9BACT|nr:helix-turn-helix domain-containing protein [Cyclobacterium plantarum]NHE58318.1 helix-turn-helix domain-containing protein [Cyclobacterium plantarum]